jgi:glutamate synthase (NADPH) large chain
LLPVSLCNTEMVDLDPVGEEDKVELLQLITQHYNYTKSSVAKFVMDDFDNQLKNFIKVFPRDYKKVLAKRKETALVGK